MATFDQRNQQVTYQYNAAGNINFETVQNRTELAVELEKLRSELSLAVQRGVLEEAAAVDVDAKLNKGSFVDV